MEWLDLRGESKTTLDYLAYGPNTDAMLATAALVERARRLADGEEDEYD